MDKYNFYNIPDILKAYKNFVLWRLEKEIDKKTRVIKFKKPPYTTGGYLASKTNPATWATYEEAVKAYNTGKFDGIGFVLTDTPFVGIDIDHCIDENGEISTEAIDIIETVGSYTELSPSGRGFHILVEGKKPIGNTKVGNYEMYSTDSEQYFTLTGNIWKGYKTIAENQSAIDYVHKTYLSHKPTAHTTPTGVIYTAAGTTLTDDEVIDNAKSHQKYGMKFSLLLDGEYESLGYSSQSEADLAFCNYLAMNTRDPEQIDRIFRGSVLYRENKWDKLHYSSTNQTYGEHTIEKALLGTVTNCITYMGVNGEVLVDIDQFHKFNTKGKPTGVLDSPLVDFILENENIFVMGTIPYIYENGVYCVDINGGKIKEKIQHLLYKEVVTAKAITSVYNLLVMQNKLQKTDTEINDHPRYWVNFKNGMYDPKENKWISHDAKYFSINQIPWEYDPEKINGEYPASKAFLETSIDSEDTKTIFQFLGLCLTVETAFQYFLVLIGNGGNGKSLLISIFEHVVGRENISAVALQELQQRFNGARLFGKLLNSCADIPQGVMDDDSMLKKITGGDTITREHKGKDATEYTSYAKMLFSTNDFPYVDDKSNGFMRRLRAISMDKKPPKIDVYLKDKLHSEIHFWICNAVMGLKELLEAGSLYESPASSAKRLEIEKRNNSVIAFKDECLCVQLGNTIKCTDMYREYEAYCITEGRKAVAYTTFKSQMEKTGIYICDSLVNGYKVYKNYAFKPWREETPIL